MSGDLWLHVWQNWWASMGWGGTMSNGVCPPNYSVSLISNVKTQRYKIFAEPKLIQGARKSSIALTRFQQQLHRGRVLNCSTR
jgi:hypothetical protein